MLNALETYFAEAAIGRLLEGISRGCRERVPGWGSLNITPNGSPDI